MPSLIYAPQETGQTGALYNAIGWFNFASVAASVTAPTTLTLTNTIRGGGSISATFGLFKVGGGTTAFDALTPPTWSGAAFGDTAYKNLNARVCLHEASVLLHPTYALIEVSSISIKNKFGQTISEYDFYFTDSETPGINDQETFTTNGSNWKVFYTLPATSEGTCTLSGVGTTIVKTSGNGNVPILVTRNPTFISQTLTGGGAMSFGVSITVIELNKVVSLGRYDSTDQFKLDISGPNSGTTITVGSAVGLQAQGLQVVSGVDGYFTFNESMASGSADPLSFYTQTVQLSNATAGGTTLPSTLTLGSGVTLVNGDYAVMTITNAPPNTVVTLNKSVDKTYSILGDTLTYTIVASNASPYTVNNVVIVDTIPTNCTLVTNSVRLNGLTTIGTPSAAGLNIGSLSANAVSTLTFNVIVTNTIPSPSTLVNNANISFSPKFNIGSVNSTLVVTSIVDATITTSKRTNRTYAALGDTITYSVILSARGNTTANNVVILDTLANGLTYVANSFAVNGVTISGANPQSPGQNIGSLTIPATYTITFNAVVNTIPTPNIIQNQEQTNYTFTLNPTIANGQNRSLLTNTVTTTINTARLSGISKSVNQTFVTIGDIMTYTITIPNTGNVTATNVVFRDTIPNGTVLVANSVTVNGVSQPGANPQTGITVGTISAGANVTITFSVQIPTQ